MWAKRNKILNPKNEMLYQAQNPNIEILNNFKIQTMNYPAASCEVSEDRNGMTMPPHPALSREGRGNSVTPQQAAGNHPD